ncbi:MAG TPA: hypothetical protein VGP53_08545 [Acidimicrobiales bacterium]|nr:hypothetical protein [Acidimicrobiales bacterium]
MTPVWRALGTVAALVAGFAIPILLLIVFLGVREQGPVAITGLIALGCAITLIVLAVKGRLRF